MPTPPVAYIEWNRLRSQTLGTSPYDWVVNSAPPTWQPLPKPLSECRLAMVATGGIYVAGQVAFHYQDDTSYRMIPADVRTEDLRATHFAYPLTDARQDINVVFPIDPLRRLVREGVIGELSPRAYAFMGGIYSARRLRSELMPRITAHLLEDAVDAALFVPV